MQNEEIAALQREISELRLELIATNEWAYGIHNLLLQLLPYLLRNHPELNQMRDSLQRSAERYEELLLHPNRARANEALGHHEASKMAYRYLARAGLWPLVEPAETSAKGGLPPRLVPE